MPAPQPVQQWYLHDGTNEIGPLSEFELRKRLVELPRPQLDEHRVRQGASEWYLASLVLSRFKELAEHGVYIRRGEASETEGPFTRERARQILMAAVEDEMAALTSESTSLEGMQAIEVKIGRRGLWGSVDLFFQWDAKLTENAKGVDEESALVPAMLIEEEPIGGEIFTAELVVESEPAAPIPMAKPVAPTRPVPSSAAAVSARSYPTVVTSPRAATKSSAKGKGKSSSPAIVIGAIAAAAVGFMALVGAVVYFVVFSGSSSEVVITRNASSGERPSVAGENLSQPSPSPQPISSQPASLPQRDRAFGAARPPIVPPGLLFRPKFNTAVGTAEAGTAFAARFAGSDYPLIISSLHLLGPAGGLNQQLAWDRLDQEWTGLALDDIVSRQRVGEVAGRPLLIPKSLPFPEISARGDVIAFRPDNVGSFRPLPLAMRPPAVGETVWLLAEVSGSNSLVHEARIEGEQDTWLVYRFKEQNVELQATSGAPVVNGDHEVVAVNAGGGIDAGATIGVGSPVHRFWADLRAQAGLR